MIKVNDYFGLGKEVAVIETAAKLLGIEDAEITVIKNDSMLDKVGSPDLIVNGLLHKNNLPGNSYNLYLRGDTNEPIRSTLCHEMLHLKQYIDGVLSLDINKKEFFWNGKEYSYDVPYMQRPWEQEVFRKQNSFISEVRKKMNPGCLLSAIFNRKKNDKK